MNNLHPLSADADLGLKTWIARRFDQAPSVPCPCGISTRLLTIADTTLANFHVTFIQDSVKHYHKDSSEIYYVLEGTGELELGDDVISVEPGVMVLIPPLLPHRLKSADGVKTIVVGFPALRPEDEYLENGEPVIPAASSRTPS